MKLGLDIKTSLSQTLTPQQIQYLKLLQLPIVQLEQHIMQEIEANPMLEEAEADEFDLDIAESTEIDGIDDPIDVHEIDKDSEEYEEKYYDESEYEIQKSKIDDERDPFEFYNMIWQDDSEIKPAKQVSNEDDDDNSFQIKDNSTLAEELIEQLKMLELSEEQLIIGTHIIGNIDEDGYLRRELTDILNEANSQIAEYNFNIQQNEYIERNKPKSSKENPALALALTNEAKEHLEMANILNSGDLKRYQSTKNGLFRNDSQKRLYNHIKLNEAEHILDIIQHLDPSGIGSRNIQECLLAQLDSIIKPNAAQKLAIAILEEAYEPFLKKHYQVIMRQLGVSEDYLREAFDVIRRLNPKPGGDDFQSENNSVIPDFIVEKDEEKDELIISVNDSSMPSIRLNKAYEMLKREAKLKKFNKETKNWIRAKHEDAKFLIQAIRQRKNTMLKVMTAIAYKQKDFFDIGSHGLKPLIYKDIAEATSLDISTVCRIVNGKYVQTRFGTYELKYYFSESLPSDDGEDVSTTVIKEELKKMIDTEPKDKPLSDDKISKMLKDLGYNVARRTVAKYREQMRIPVARLRRDL